MFVPKVEGFQLDSESRDKDDCYLSLLLYIFLVGIYSFTKSRQFHLKLKFWTPFLRGLEVDIHWDASVRAASLRDVVTEKWRPGCQGTVPASVTHGEGLGWTKAEWRGVEITVISCRSWAAG